MKTISHFLLFLYVGFFFFEPIIVRSEKSQDLTSYFNFSLYTQVSKVYMAPLFQNTGNVEANNIAPFVIAPLVSVFNFKKSSISHVITGDYSPSISAYALIDWPKIAINAP